MNQCDTTLHALQRARANLNLRGNRRIGTRYSQLFLHPTKRSQEHQVYIKSVAVQLVGHISFIECQQSVIPCTNYEHDALLKAGLGEQRVFIPDTDASGEEF